MDDAREQPDGSSEPADWIGAVGTRRHRGSFLSLFTLFAPKVKAYLVRGGLNEPHAEELAQETLLAVWRKADQFDPARATAETWIYAIARNLRVDMIRRERQTIDDRIGELPRHPLTPEELLDDSERAGRLLAAIIHLPDEQAEVVRMSYFHSRTHPQIATALGLPLGTVKSRIRLATAHLRQTLGSRL